MEVCINKLATNTEQKMGESKLVGRVENKVELPCLGRYSLNKTVIVLIFFQKYVVSRTFMGDYIPVLVQ